MLPDVRLVYIVRHPIERMRSMYLHQLASGREKLPITDAFRTNAYYLNSSRYAWQLDHHLEHVPPDAGQGGDDGVAARRAAGHVGRTVRIHRRRPRRRPRTEVRRGQTEDKRVPVPLKARLSRLPGYARPQAGALQNRCGNAVEGATMRPVEAGMAALPAELEAELVGQLRPDMSASARSSAPTSTGGDCSPDPRGLVRRRASATEPSSRTVSVPGPYVDGPGLA